MAMTAEQVQQFIEGVAKNTETVTNALNQLASLAAKSAEHPNLDSHRRKRMLDEKGFSRVSKFSHGEDKWSDWAWEFKISVGTQCAGMKALMEYVETHEYESTAQIRGSSEQDNKKADEVKLETTTIELYEMLVLMTEGESRLIVKSVKNNDGLMAWHKLHVQYNRRTLARLMRVHREVMHPKSSRALGDLVSNILAWEERWRKMMRELPNDQKVPPLWQMGALLEICPDNIQDAVYQKLDEIGEDYERMKQLIITTTTNTLERNGPVPMEIGSAQKENDESVDVDAIRREMVCYTCGGQGHGSWQCPRGDKGKGKGPQGPFASKGFSGKGESKGFGGKASWHRKGSRYPTGAKGEKGSGKGKGFQGTCFKCWKVGHKAFECQEVEYEEDADSHAHGDETEWPCDGLWTVGSVDVQAGVSLANQFSVLAEDVDEVDEGKLQNHEATFEIMPVEVVSKPENKAKQKKVKKGKITVDSGAGKCVWPKRMKVEGKLAKLTEKIKLTAANGTDIPVYGQRRIDFRVDDRKCGMNFLVTDVHKPLAAVSAIVDQGNTVVFSKGEWGNYIENDTTGERIYLNRERGTYVMEVDFVDEVADMEIDAVEGEDAKHDVSMKCSPCGSKSVFRRPA